MKPGKIYSGFGHQGHQPGNEIQWLKYDVRPLRCGGVRPVVEALRLTLPGVAVPHIPLPETDLLLQRHGHPE